MIKVKFFASLRETLGVDEADLDYQPGLSTVAAVRDMLVSEKGAEWQEALVENNVLMAVNQVMSDLSDPVEDGDEVAFFPPVTGG